MAARAVTMANQLGVRVQPAPLAVQVQPQLVRQWFVLVLQLQ